MTYEKQGAASPDVLALDGAASGTLAYGDRVRYQIHLEAEQQYIFDLNVTQLFLPSIRFYDQDGNEAGTSSNLGSGKTSGYIVVAQPGDYVVELSVTGAGTASYTLAPRQVQDDYGRIFATAEPLLLGVERSGVLETPVDVDLFKITLQAGVTYEFETTSSALVTNFRIRDPQLNVVKYSGVDFINTYTPETSGDFYVSAYWARKEGQAYSFYVNSLDTELRAGMATARELTDWDYSRGVEGTLDGSVHERDWFKVELSAGREYDLSLKGSALSMLRLFSSRGELLYDSAGRSPYAVLKIAEDGDYYAEIVPNRPTKVASYTLTLKDVTPDRIAPKLVSIAYQSGLDGKVLLVFDEYMGSINTSATRLSYDNGSEQWSKPAVLKADPNTPWQMALSSDTYLKPGATYTLTVASGAVWDSVGNAMQGEIKYSFSTPAVVQAGGAGDDYLIGAGAGQVRDGGAGVDTIYYDGALGKPVIQREGDHVRVTLAQGQGADTLYNIERLVTPGSAIALDIDGHGGQAYRLYQAAFNRTPDQAGVGYWIAQLDQGASLHDVADSFVHSAEFTGKYGAGASNAAFVDLLYHNVLHRDADAGGAAFWLKVLQDGASRADVLSSFSESPENQAALVGVIGNGFSYIPYY